MCLEEKGRSNTVVQAKWHCAKAKRRQRKEASFEGNKAEQAVAVVVCATQ